MTKKKGQAVKEQEKKTMREREKVSFAAAGVNTVMR